MARTMASRKRERGERATGASITSGSAFILPILTYASHDGLILSADTPTRKRDPEPSCGESYSRPFPRLPRGHTARSVVWKLTKLVVWGTISGPGSYTTILWT